MPFLCVIDDGLFQGIVYVLWRAIRFAIIRTVDGSSVLSSLLAVAAKVAPTGGFWAVAIKGVGFSCHGGSDHGQEEDEEGERDTGKDGCQGGDLTLIVGFHQLFECCMGG